MKHDYQWLRNLALSGAVLLFLAGCKSPEERAKGYYESAIGYLNDKDFERAAVELRNALKLNENYAEAWFAMAQIEQHAQSWERVYADLTKVLEINPKFVPALAALATLQGTAGDYPAALKNANMAVELEPKNADLIVLKASVMLKIGDFSGAVLEANKALEIVPNHAEATAILAANLLERNELGQAIELVDKALAGHPDSLTLYLAKLAILQKSGDQASQIATLRSLSAAFPRRRDFKASLVHILRATGRLDEAERELRLAIQASPDDIQFHLDLVDFLKSARGAQAAQSELIALTQGQAVPLAFQVALADLYFDSGKTSEAIQLLRDVSAARGIGDDGISARIKLASMLLRNKDATGASDVLREVLQNDSQNVDALVLRGAINIDAGNTELAISDLRTAANLRVSAPNIRVLLATAYERGGQVELAAREWDGATRVSGYDPEVGIGQVAFLVRRGSADRAEELLRELDLRRPGNQKVLTQLAKILLKRGDWEGAEKAARSLKAAAADSTAADVILGQALLQQKQPEDAIAILLASAKHAPADTSVLRSLVQAYIQSGNLDGAQAFLASAAQANPNNVEATLLQGVVLLRQNKMDEAKGKFEQALRADPAYDQTYLSLSEFYKSAGQAGPSVDILKTGLGKVVSPYRLQLLLAKRYEDNGDFDKAIGVYEELLDANPNSLPIINNLVSLITDHRDDTESLARAAALGEQLKFSQIAAYRETLGWLLVKSGKIKEGLNQLERSIDELGSVATARLHLGLAYQVIGDKERAKEQLKQARELAGNSAEKEMIDKHLATLEGGATP